MKLKPGDSVLEVGVGTGIHAQELLKMVDADYTGVDISKKCIAISKKRLPKKVKLMVANAEDLKFKDDSFDAVFCSGTLHHFNDQEKGLSEMVRVTKKGGMIYINTPNYASFEERHYKVRFPFPPAYLPRFFSYLYLILRRRPYKFLKTINFLTIGKLNKILGKMKGIDYKIIKSNHNQEIIINKLCWKIN